MRLTERRSLARVSAVTPTGWLRASWLHGLVLAIVFMMGLATEAVAETRTLKLHFIHTKETAEIPYKRNGRYLPDGLKKINRFLRDWRRNEPTKMDPQLLDVVWEIYRTAGARQPIHVVSAYRSPATNSLLRSRSKGVAKKSQHMLGKAMDFYIPGVSLSKLRASALRIQAGGVGYYPRSGSPFIHVDVGNVRHWPRMSRRELLAVFPDGKTIHVPTDGKPLPGFEQALASYEKRRSSGSLAVASASRSKGFFATLFGGGADEEEDIAVAEAPRAAPARRKAEPVVAAAEEEAPAVRTRAGQALPGVPAAAPTPAPAAVPAPAPEPEQAPETPETIIAALPSRSVPVPLLAPRPQADVGPTVAVAEAAEQAGVPAATALASAAPIPPAEPAPGIPVPSRRPDYTAPAVAVAAVEPAMPETVAAALVPAPRPTTGERALAEAFGANAVPATRPESPIDAVLDDALRTADADADTVLEATPAPVLAASAPAPTPVAPVTTAATMQPEPAAEPVREKPITVAALAPATPRSALLERKAEDVRPSVRTTGKTGKPRQGVRRDEPKPQVMPSEPSDARWAFDRHSVTQNTRGTVKPSFAYNLVRTAPRTVYTAGFSSGSGQATANGFSGNAVTFLPVARFDQD